MTFKTLSILSIIFCVTSCINVKKGNGNIQITNRSVPSFTSVNVGNSIDADVQQGPATVQVEADENIKQYVETIVSDGELKIRLASGFNFNDYTVKVHITNPEFNKLTASSSANIEGKSTISNKEKISLYANSSSKIVINVDAPNVEVEASSSADIVVSGKSKNINAKSSSSATVDVEELKAENAVADASSSSVIHIFASQKIDAKANSSADISYKGGAKEVVQNASRSGTISKK